MTGPILRLTSAADQQDVYINFAFVMRFHTAKSGDGTWIGLMSTEGVSVQEAPETIVLRLGDTDSVWVGVE